MNNNAIYNAVLSGAGAGVEAQRWLTKTDVSDYNNVASVAEQFALQVDSGIPSGSINADEAALMQSICQSVMISRLPIGTVQSDYGGLALAVIALFNRLRALILPNPDLLGLAYWIFVEQYLSLTGGDLHAAIVLAHAEHTTEGTVFVLPGGTYQWIGGSFSPRNDTTWIGYGCTIERNQAGVAGAQTFFFLRSESDASHADSIVIRGGRFRFLNVLTSYFSAAVQFEAASNCIIEDAWAECTFDAAATEGRIRWGFNLFGGDLTLGAGKNNRFSGIKLTFSQIQGCGAGRSVDGVQVVDTQVVDANDLAISVVSGVSTQSLENVSIRNTQCHNSGGTGVILAGSDGAGTGVGVGTLRNLEIDGVWLDGRRSTPDLAFAFISAITVNGGITTENVVISNVGTRLSPNGSNQARSIIISSQDDEISWRGLSLSNLQLGVVTTLDPLEALFVAARNLTGVEINNVTVHGTRGIWLQNADGVLMTNCRTLDGTCSVVASGRNLSGLQFQGCTFTRSTGFQPTMEFTSATGKSMADVMISNAVLNGNGVPINTALNGGSMQMYLCNIQNTSGSNPTAETLAGIIKIKNVNRFIVPVIVSVPVPAVGAASVGYVDISMAGTRLADVAIGECVVACPSADLVAAGAGGGFINAMVKAVGTIRLAFIGPLAGGSVIFNFDRVG